MLRAGRYSGYLGESVLEAPRPGLLRVSSGVQPVRRCPAASHAAAAPPICTKSVESARENAMVKMLDRLISLRLGGAAFPLGKGFRPAGIATPPIIPSNGYASASAGAVDPKDARGWQKRAAVGGRVIPAAFAALALTACATTSEPRVVIREVKVPVAVACAADPGSDPAFSDTPEALRSARDIFAKVQLLLAGRAQRDGRLAELNAAVSACR